ncbi:hypothetical protein Tco_0084838 [Tanacetum coccineum]
MNRCLPLPKLEEASISLLPEAEVERLLVMTTPSSSPPISLSPPSAGERLARCTTPPAHSSLPPVPSPLLPSSWCPTQIQILRIASIQAPIDAVTAALPSPPLPLLPPSLYIPPPVNHRDDLPKSEMPPHKRMCLSTLGSKYQIGESSTARPTREAVPEVAPMTVGERVDMDSHQVDLLMGDRITLQEIVWTGEEEAYASREAWAYSIGLSQAELLAHREQQRRARQPGPDARIPDHQDAFGDADSHI